ncbi:MAG TPA: hypothetical protein DCR14_20025 [Acidimicrobiaceae bacterium]|nr:hypothetical protein [Acidimicrobiaceae bacterium]
MFLCWSAKGGSGTTVVASSLALVLARTRPVVLVDLAGDVPAALGVPEPTGPGVHDWLTSSTAAGAALANLSVAVDEELRVVPSGGAPQADVSAQRWADLAGALAAVRGSAPHTCVVVDAGHLPPPTPLLQAAQQRLLVTRSCYLAIRRAAAQAVEPTGVVLLKEGGRAVGPRDLEHCFGAPVVAEVPWDPAVFRAVDAGLLASRLPPSIARPLGRLVAHVDMAATEHVA